MDPMDIDDFQTTSDALISWLNRNGATISPKIQLEDLRKRAAGRGVVATQDLSEDEEIFTIPRSSILTVESTDLPANIRRKIDDPWLSLILVMIYEYLQGASSRWKPYLDVLPEDFDTLMFWSESELQGLEGSAVVDKVGRDGADATFSEQLIPIIAQHADVFRTGSRSNDALLALCHRMGSTIMSYAFDLEKPDTDGPPKNDEEWEEEDDAALPKGMIPLADMLNADADCNNAKLFYEDNKVVMKTVKAVRAGEELYNDFGPLPRADLLRRYGYVTENYAQYDVVEVSADMIRAAAIRQFRLSEADIESKWRYLDDQGVLDDAYDIARAGSEEGPFPEELRVLVNVLATPKSEFEKLMTKNKLPKPEPSSLARNLLRDVLVRRYALYPADAGTRPMLSGRAAMADQVIRGEKQVIREAFDALTEASTNKKRGADTLEEEAAVIRQPAKR